MVEMESFVADAGKGEVKLVLRLVEPGQTRLLEKAILELVGDAGLFWLMCTGLKVWLRCE